jgi:hypothetical protein
MVWLLAGWMGCAHPSADTAAAAPKGLSDLSQQVALHDYGSDWVTWTYTVTNDGAPLGVLDFTVAAESPALTPAELSGLHTTLVQELDGASYNVGDDRVVELITVSSAETQVRTLASSLARYEQVAFCLRVLGSPSDGPPTMAPSLAP